MKDNFDLKQFLLENNLTAGSRQLKEEISEDVWDRLDTAIANDDDEALKAIALELLGKAGNWAKEKVSQGADWMKQKLMKAHGITDDDLNEAFNPQSKLAQIIAQAWAEKDLDKAKQIIRDLIEPSRIKAKDDILRKMEPINNKKEFDHYLANSLLKFEGLGLNESDTVEPEEKDNELKADPTVFSKNENKMTPKEKRLVEMVNAAMNIHPHDNDDLEDNVSNDDAYSKAFDMMPEGEDIVKENPLPEYNTIEELMKDIEEGTSKTALEYRMKRTKELYEALDEQLKSLEEGEHSKHIDKSHTRKMRQDSAKLRRYEAKLIKEYERKYNKKATKKAAAPKKEEVPMEEIAVNESKGFDLRKFLVENKLTTNSRLIKEDIEADEETVAEAFQQAGIDLTQSVYVVEARSVGAGGEQDEPYQISAKNLLLKLEKDRVKYNNEDNFSGVQYDYNAAEYFPSEESGLPENVTAKLAVTFGDEYEYVIFQ